MSRRRWLSGMVGLVVAALGLSACDFDGAYDLPLPGHEVDADDAFEVTAYFQDVLNVVPRSPVKVDDVTVGEVKDVERSGWNAKVTLLVRKDVDLPDNAIADIRQVSLLGEKYIALEAPTTGAAADRLSDGDTIELAATGRNPEVEEVLGALSYLLTGGGVAQLGAITKEANAVMSGREDRLRGLLSSLDSVVATVDGQRADIVRALRSMKNLTGTLNDEKDTIADALDATGPAIKVLAAQHKELIAMLKSLDRLGKVGTRVINASKGDVLKILKDLSPILRRLREADEQLAPGLNLLISFPFPQSANGIVHGDFANTIARVDLDFANLFRTLGIPEIQLPDIGEVVGQVGRCLQSGRLFGPACAKVLADLDLLKNLKAECKKVGLKGTPVCKALSQFPDLTDLMDLLKGGLLGSDGPLSLLGDGLLGVPSSQQPDAEAPRTPLGAVA